MLFVEDDRLREFVIESNRIEEGISGWAVADVEAHRDFLAASRVGIATLERFVVVVQPGARLRDRQGLDVRVAAYRPPPGGPNIRRSLAILLDHSVDGVHGDAYRLRPIGVAMAAGDTYDPYKD